MLVTGDFNVALEPRDVYDPETLRGEVGFHPDEQSILRDYLSWGLVDVLRKHRPEAGLYTFWDYRIPNALKRKMGWRIDYIFATPPLAQKCKRVWIDLEARTAEKPSDHTFLVAEFEMLKAGRDRGALRSRSATLEGGGQKTLPLASRPGGPLLKSCDLQGGPPYCDLSDRCSTGTD